MIPRQTKRVNALAAATVTADQLTGILAERIMGWRVRPDRFLMGKRRWQPRWRFRPMERLEDAFELLEKAAPQSYAMEDDGSGFCVRVRIGDTSGQAHDVSKARAVTLALAQALGIEVES